MFSVKGANYWRMWLLLLLITASFLIIYFYLKMTKLSLLLLICPCKNYDVCFRIQWKWWSWIFDHLMYFLLPFSLPQYQWLWGKWENLHGKLLDRKPLKLPPTNAISPQLQKSSKLNMGFRVGNLIWAPDRNQWFAPHLH